VASADSHLEQEIRQEEAYSGVGEEGQYPSCAKADAQDQREE